MTEIKRNERREALTEGMVAGSGDDSGKAGRGGGSRGEGRRL